MAKEEYEFVPTREFNKLSEELTQLKKNPFLTRDQSKTMKSSIDDLHTSIKGLLELLKLAHQDMSIEEREEKLLKKEITPILKRFDTLEENQETIANGIVLVSDAVTKLSHKVNEISEDIEKFKAPVSEPNDAKRTVTRKVFTTRSTPQVGLPQFENGEYSQNMPPPIPGSAQGSPSSMPPNMPPNAYQSNIPPANSMSPSASSSAPPSAPPAEEPKHKGLFGKK